MHKIQSIWQFESKCSVFRKLYCKLLLNLHYTSCNTLYIGLVFEPGQKGTFWMCKSPFLFFVGKRRIKNRIMTINWQNFWGVCPTSRYFNIKYPGTNRLNAFFFTIFAYEWCFSCMRCNLFAESFIQFVDWNQLLHADTAVNHLHARDVH